MASSPAPEPLGVPQFAPLRVRGGSRRLRRALRRQRRAMAAGLAVTAAALAASSARGADDPGSRSGAHGQGGSGTGALAAAAPARDRHPGDVLVSAPVRIADAATVRLLRPGDRVDVIAAADSPAEDSPAKVVASGVRVAAIPRAGEDPAGGGALIVLSVPRATAATLAGAGATSRLAVAVC
ncbi:RcpC/CpaB family pilus assembly protein [Streptomyces sp. NPDC049597]|uniref:RcpC/CpaB family pilus assembly protein n=1 Tax=Streptomyces sp. NPDC049597 TaxID=3155276 RepID=UPI003439A375